MHVIASQCAHWRGNPFSVFCSQDDTCFYAPPIFFSSCRKEDGPRPGQKKRAPTRWTCGAGPGWSSRSSDMVHIWVQSWNSLAEPIPRGAASLGAALAAERTWSPAIPGGIQEGARSSTLPHCLSRACFATARQRRGCGAENPPSSATGSGGFSAPLGRFKWGGSREGKNTESSPPLCPFFSNFSLDKQRKVDTAGMTSANRKTRTD